MKRPTRMILGLLLAASAAAPLTLATASAAPAALVRVDQLGYASTAAKHAYLMTAGTDAGAQFALIDSHGNPVLTGPVGGSRGGWNTRYRFVYDLDFSSLSAPGNYLIVVSGPYPAQQPVRVASAAALYRPPLANTVSFLQNERDGAHFIPSALRTSPGHLNDEHAMTYLTPKTDGDGNFTGDLHPLGRTIDASGGWWDAGDYLKFVETTSYTEAVLLTGTTSFPSAFDADYVAEARFGLDWLQRMWDDSTRTLYYQVGIGEGNNRIAGDHDIWRLPQADDTYHSGDASYRYIRNRPVFRAAPPGAPISPNLAGRLAAGFALGYQQFRTTDPAYAAACLRSAEHVYDLVDTHPGKLLTVIPYDFYPETEWRDDLEFGATALYNALAVGTPPRGLPHTDPSFYLSGAAHWAHAYISGPNDAADTLNLYDVSGLAHYQLYRALQAAGDPSGLEVTRAALRADLRKQLAGALRLAGNDPFGFGFPWGSYDSASHGFGLAVMASEYAALTGDASYRGDAAAWAGNVLGANAWGVSQVAGDGTNFPHCLSHQVANIAGSLDGSSPVLAGAVVEGTNGHATHGRVAGMRSCPADGVDRFAPFNAPHAVFADNVQSYSTVEPAIDLSASSPLAFAWLSSG